MMMLMTLYLKTNKEHKSMFHLLSNFSCRRSLCLRFSRWNCSETTVIWRRAATLTALRSSQPPWSTMWGRTTAATITALHWLLLEWVWRWPRAGRRPSDRPWCPSRPSRVWPVQPVRGEITVRRIYSTSSVCMLILALLPILEFSVSAACRILLGPYRWGCPCQIMCVTHVMCVETLRFTKIKSTHIHI